MSTEADLKALRSTAAGALREAGVELPASDLRDVLVARLELTDDGVAGKDGRPLRDHVADLQRDPAHAAAFREEKPTEKPSHHGKAWAEMTLDEKVTFTADKYPNATL